MRHRHDFTHPYESKSKTNLKTDPSEWLVDRLIGEGNEINLPRWAGRSEETDTGSKIRIKGFDFWPETTDLRLRLCVISQPRLLVFLCPVKASTSRKPIVGCHVTGGIWNSHRWARLVGRAQQDFSNPAQFPSVSPWTTEPNEHPWRYNPRQPTE